jgi:hypothetical protein
LDSQRSGRKGPDVPYTKLERCLWWVGIPVDPKIPRQLEVERHTFIIEDFLGAVKKKNHQ